MPRESLLNHLSGTLEQTCAGVIAGENVASKILSA